MKIFRISATLMCAALISILLTMTVAASEPVKSDKFNLLINGDKVVFGNNAPVIVNGTTLLPLRFVFEQLNGDKLDWNDVERLATLTRGETIVKLWIDTGKAEVNGTEWKLDVAPIIYNNNTYVPLAFLANAFDMSVFWDAGSFTAYIADNERLYRIAELINNNSETNPNRPKMSFDMILDFEMKVRMSGEPDENMHMRMEGKIQQDYANKFQHMNLTTIIDGEKVLLESYDDGNAMYMIIDDMVIKTDSVIEIVDEFISAPFLGFEIERRLYSGLKLVEDNKTITVSGDLFIPNELLGEILSEMIGMEEFAQIMVGMDIKYPEPINMVMVFDRETGLMVSMKVQFALEMSMKLFGEEIFGYFKYAIDMPRIEYGGEFDTTVPSEIIAKAVEFY